ncbi:MAG: hypothetical protein ACFB0B_06855 [Thermonemataceae bacterium]
MEQKSGNKSLQTFQTNNYSKGKFAVSQGNFPILSLEDYLTWVDIGTTDDLDEHHQAIFLELNWWLQIVCYRYKNPDSKVGIIQLMDDPKTSIRLPHLPINSHFRHWIDLHGLGTEERLMLITTVALSLDDFLFFPLLEMMQTNFSSIIGGRIVNASRQFLPSIQTVLFLLGGISLKERAHYQKYFQSQHKQLPAWGIESKSAQSLRSGYETEVEDEWKNLLISLRPAIWQYFLVGALPQP